MTQNKTFQRLASPKALIRVLPTLWCSKRITNSVFASLDSAEDMKNQHFQPCSSQNTKKKEH